jgi:uncharacterized protein DUF4238
MKHFAASHDLLWVYDRKLKTCKQLHPFSICFQRDLYAFKTPGPHQQVIETEFLRNVDGTASSALKELPSVLATPKPELLREIIYFAALQYTRVPANKDFISMIYETGAQDLMDVTFANVERATAAMKKYEAETGDKSTVTPESMVEAVKNKRIKPVATEMPFLESIIKHTDFVANVFTEMDIKILVSPPKVGFVLSDNPVTLVPHPQVKLAGFKTPGAFMFMPLTRSLCLRLGQPGSGNGPKIVDRETVRFVNENTAINSDRFVMGPSQMQIESVIRRSGSAEMNPNPRWISVKSQDEKGGILRQLIAQPRQVHYRAVM